MRRIGIIAEYNPFHSGHAAQIALLRQMGADSIAVVMSGSYVQRGSPALFSKFLRARAALAAGADLVAELPVPWAAAEADRFAEGGVFLLAAAGCEEICFGAEQADLDRLWQLARLLEDPAFDAALTARHTAGGGSLAALRARLAEQELPGAAALLAGPNNALGIAYLRAIDRLGLKMRAIAIPRVGAAHDAPLTDGKIASASALRALFYEQGAAALAPYLPESALPLYLAAEQEGAVADFDAFSLSLLTLLRAADPADFTALPGAGGEGLDRLLAKAAARAGSTEQLYDLLKSKRYTHARLRRLALAAYLGLREDLPRLPPYLRLLGGNDAGLREIPGRAAGAEIPVSQSLAKLCRLGGEAERVARLEARAGALWNLCLRAPRAASAEFTEKFIRL